MFIAGILITIVGVFMSALILADNVGDVAILICMTTVFTYVITSVGVTLGTGNVKLYFKVVNALVSKNYYISAADKEKGTRYLKLMGKTVNFTGLLLAVMSVTMLLIMLNDLSQIGPYIAVSLVSVFYLLLIQLVFIQPGIYVLKSRYNQEEKRVISEKQVMDKLLELCYKQGITPEEIMDAAEIRFKE
jgi:hypothetical protein